MIPRLPELVLMCKTGSESARPGSAESARVPVEEEEEEGLDLLPVDEAVWEPPRSPPHRLMQAVN